MLQKDRSENGTVKFVSAIVFWYISADSSIDSFRIYFTENYFG